MSLQHGFGGNNPEGTGEATGATAFSHAMGKAQENNESFSQRPRGGFSFAAMGDVIDTPMAFNQASQFLLNLKTAMEKQISQDSGFEVKLLPLDANGGTGLGISTLAVVVRNKKVQPNLVAWHALILAGSMEGKLPPQVVALPAVNGMQPQQVENVMVPGDAYDAKMVEIIHNAVQAAFPDKEVISADGRVVYADFDLTDEGQVRTLARDATQTAASELGMANPNRPAVSLKDASSDKLAVRITFNANEVDEKGIDSVGQPFRADFSATLSTQVQQAAQQAQQNISLNNVAKSTLVSAAHGYVDLVYSPVVPEDFAGSFGQFGLPAGVTPADINRKWIPQIIITENTTPRLQTPLGALLSLIPALGLLENNSWVGALRPRQLSGIRKDDLDMNDIGNLGWEIKDPSTGQPFGYIDTKAANFNEQALMKFLSLYLSPRPVLSLDVPECGGTTAVNRIFLATAKGSARAHDVLVASANELTDNIFGKYYDGKGIALDDIQRIHTGYYIDSAGNKQDLRKIAYLAIAAACGEKKPEIIRDWSESFVVGRYPPLQALNGRRRIFESLWPSATITGYSDRFTLRPEFVDAWQRAVSETGLDIRVQGQFNDMNSHERASASYLAGGQLNGNNALFSRGAGFGGGGFGGFGGGFAGGGRF